MAKKKYTVAVVGATGAVGTELLRVLEERRFPVKGIRPLASARSAGRRVPFNGSTYSVEELRGRSFEGIDLALFSAGAGRSLEFGPEAVKRGAVVVDNSSAFRMAERVPLVVPEVNPQALARHRGLIANPNCSTIIMLLPLAPLHQAAGIRRIVVSTYQSVSGAGAKAMAQLERETRQALRQLRVRRGQFLVDARIPDAGRAKGERVLPRQIAFNVIPQVDAMLENRYTKEEMKLVNETKKILEAPDLAVTATCVRVPVFIGHSEAIWIETERSLSAEKARQLLGRTPGVRLVDESTTRTYPLPINAAGRDEVFVGRVRNDLSVPHALALWVCGDNLRKGAATNAVQIAELLVKSL